MAQRLSGIDTAFLCLEHTAPMHMGAVGVFGPARRPDPVRLAKLLADRAQRLALLRQRVRVSWLGAVWEEAPEFLAGDHVHAHQLNPPGGRDELAALVARLMADPLDVTRPLWELHVITGLRDDRFALLIKLHHALADGAGAVGIGLGLLDGCAPQHGSGVPSGSPTGLSTAAQAALNLITKPERWLEAATDAAAGLSHVAHQGSQMLDIAASVARNVRLGVPAPSMVTAPSAPRRVELLPLELRELQRVRRRHGGTVNDLVLTIVTGALRRWLDTRGHPVEDLTLRALVPVSRRPRSGGSHDGNQLSGYLCDLPVGEADPVRRLELIRAAMDRNKQAGPGRGPGALSVLAGQVPSLVHRLAAPVAGHAAPMLFDTVITNVPLPDIPVSLDGAEMCEIYPLVPVASGHVLAIAASSYRDTVHIGLHAQREALPDMEKLSQALPYALTELSG